MKSSTISSIQKPPFGTLSFIVIRFIHFIPILWEVLLINETLSSSLVIVEHTQYIKGDNLNTIITSMGVDQINPGMASFLNFNNSGIGIYLIIGLIGLITLSFIGAITLNKWIEFRVIGLALILGVLDEVNIKIMTSITLSPSATNLSIRLPFTGWFIQYLAIVIFTLEITRFIRQMQKSANQGELATS